MASRHNPKIYQTIFKAIKHVYLFPNRSFAENETVIRELLPKAIGEDVFQLHPNFKPKSTELHVQRKFSVYNQKNSTGIFACFSKKCEKKELVIYNCGFGIYDEKTGELECFVNFNTCSISMKRGIREVYVVIHIPLALNKDGAKEEDLEKQRQKEKQKKREKVIYIETDDQHQTDIIDQYLQNIRKTTEASKETIKYVSTIYNFWKFRCITELEFQNMCDSGDILLFKSKPQKKRSSEGSKLKNSSKFVEMYEHVALIIRNVNNDILVIEKNKDGKIGINYWLNIVHFELYVQIEKIAFRKLEVERTKEFLTTFQHWVVKSLDKQYETQISKIYKIPPETTIPTIEEKSAYESCDFVAQCYNKLGLISISRQSQQFWPIDFTEARQFPFVTGSFGPECVVVFSPKEEQIESKV